MSAILLTGSEGNIGPYVRKRLVQDHPECKVIRVARSVADPTDPPDYIGDLRDRHLIERIFAEHRVESVIHLAGSTYTTRDLSQREYDILSNELLSLMSVLEQSSSVQRFVYLSSALVYESAPNVPLVEELTTAIAPPRTPYGIAKLSGERLVQAFGTQFSVPVTIWRPFNVVSPRESHTEPGGHVFVDLYRRIFVERSDAITLYGGGVQVRSFTWVEDIAEALSLFLFDARVTNQVLNLGSQNVTTLSGLCELMVAIGKDTGYLPADYSPDIEGAGTFAGVDSSSRLPILDRIHALEWRARMSLQDTFTRFITDKHHA